MGWGLFSWLAELFRDNYDNDDITWEKIPPEIDGGEVTDQQYYCFLTYNNILDALDTLYHWYVNYYDNRFMRDYQDIIETRIDISKFHCPNQEDVCDAVKSKYSIFPTSYELRTYPTNDSEYEYVCDIYYHSKCQALYSCARKVKSLYEEVENELKKREDENS